LSFVQWREVIAADGLVADEIARPAAVIDGVAGVIVDADGELFLAPILPEVCQLNCQGGGRGKSVWRLAIRCVIFGDVAG
jgi:hypothetical protein